MTLDELSAWLTTELRKIEDCHDSSVAVQYLLRNPDADGCNWSDEVVLSVGRSATADYLYPHVRRLVGEARLKFNVKE